MTKAKNLAPKEVSLPTSRGTKQTHVDIKKISSPDQRAFKREITELNKRAYELAKNARLMAGVSPFVSSPDEALATAKMQLMGASRELALNSPTWKKAKTLYQTNLVGAAGYTLKSNIGGETPNVALNKRVEKDFWRWANSTECDAAGMQDLTGLQSMWVGNWFDDGDVLIRFIEVERTPENPAGLQMHSYPADALDMSMRKSLSPDIKDEKGRVVPGTKIVMGVEQDKYGRHLKYHLRVDNQPEVVDASECILLYLRSASNSSRGAPLGHAVMGLIYQIESLTKHTLQAAKLNQPGGFLERDPAVATSNKTLNDLRNDFGTGADEDEENEGDPLNGLVVDKAPGETIMLPAGVKFSNQQTDFPVEALGPFLLSLQREVAAGLNLGHEELYCNVAEASFSSTRISTVAHRDWYKSMHQFLIARVVYPIYRKWVMRMFFREGESYLSGTQFEEALKDATFNGRNFGWVDPARDSKEKQDGIAMGLYSIEKIGYEMGEDVHANMLANAALLEKARKLGVPISGLYDPTKQAELRIQGEALEAQANAQAQSEEKEAERQAKGFDVMQRSLDGLRTNLDAVRNAPAPVAPAPAPITVTPQVTVEAPVLNVSIGQRKRVKSIPVRDERGLVVSIDTVIEEDTEDAPPEVGATEGAPVQTGEQPGQEVQEPPMEAEELVAIELGRPQEQEPSPESQEGHDEPLQRDAEKEEEAEEVAQ